MKLFQISQNKKVKVEPGTDVKTEANNNNVTEVKQEVSFNKWQERFTLDFLKCS